MSLREVSVCLILPKPSPSCTAVSSPSGEIRSSSRKRLGIFCEYRRGACSHLSAEDYSSSPRYEVTRARRAVGIFLDFPVSPLVARVVLALSVVNHRAATRLSWQFVVVILAGFPGSWNKGGIGERDTPLFLVNIVDLVSSHSRPYCTYLLPL